MSLEVTDLAPVGHGVERPEHVVVTSDGRLFASDKASAVAEILGENSIRRIGNAGGDITPLLRGEVDGQPLKWLNYSSGALWHSVSTATVSHLEIDPASSGSGRTA